MNILLINLCHADQLGCNLCLTDQPESYLATCVLLSNLCYLEHSVSEQPVIIGPVSY